MANIIGTAGRDLVHLAGDGQSPGFGETEFATATDAADTIDTGADDDRIFAGAGNDSITAGTGNDFIFADDGNDTVNADDGNDTIVGGQGTDNLRGGAGNDVFQIDQVSDIDGLAETINGGGDFDRLDFSALGAGGAVNLANATISNVEELDLSNNDVTLTAGQLGAFSTIGAGFGTERLILSGPGTADLTGASIGLVDEIRGSSGADTIIITGVAGDQFLNGRGGDDMLFGGNGNDRLAGGNGNDTLTGDFGNDTLLGGNGADNLTGGDGNDVLQGGADVDAMAGGIGNDTFRFTLMSDVSGFAETIDGGADHDRLDLTGVPAGGVVDLSLALITSVEELDLNGTSVRLTAAQLGDFDTIAGSFGFDRIILSGPGTADLSGASFSLIDEIRGSTGADTIILTGVTTGLAVNGDLGNDTIRGTDAADLLIGGDGKDTLIGNVGDDTIRGGQGADNLQGGAGNDAFQIGGTSEIGGLAEKIDGGADLDTLDLSTFGAFGPVDLSAATITAVEQLSISGNDVTLTAAQLGGFAGIFAGFGTERLILSGPGTADLTGAAINLIDEIRGSGGDDTIILTGVANGQFVSALAGNDTITGSDGNDKILGGDGNDTLQGGGGNDVLTGGLGADLLRGDAGADTFNFDDVAESPNSGGRDTIADFVPGEDKIDLADADANSEVAGNQAFSYIGVAAFSGTAGELRYVAGQLTGDVNGDGVGDFRVDLTGAPAITAADFIL